MLGVPQEPDAAAKDDFWKVRKAGFSLLMAHGRRCQADRVRRRHGRQPRPAPGVLRPLPPIVERHGVRGGVLRSRRRRLPAHPADHQREDHAQGVATLRSIAREVSDLVVEFGGSMSGEHGDGLARSLWNRKLFGPEVYCGLAAGEARFDPENLLNPDKVIGDADPGDHLRIGPQYHPHEPADTVFDFSGQGGSPAPSRCVRALAPAARRRPVRCARATWSRATRCTRPAAAPTRCAWS